nr:reverse transcriptase domain-containing protein [Tanacetum cinerariifolium]
MSNAVMIMILSAKLQVEEVSEMARDLVMKIFIDANKPKSRSYFSKDCRAGPRMVNPLNAKNPIAARRTCYDCGGTDHYKSACPRLNRAPRQLGNHPNQAMAIEGGHGRGNNSNPARGRAILMEA